MAGQVFPYHCAKGRLRYLSNTSIPNSIGKQAHGCAACEPKDGNAARRQARSTP
jgi:hypothetical protein